MKSGQFTGHGITIYYEIHGDEWKAPILAIHGGPGGCIDRDIIDLFDKSVCYVIVYDQRGCGKSSPYGDVGTADENFEDAKRLVKHLRLHRFMVFGHSWGARIALELGKRHPSSVSSIILCSPWLGRKEDIESFLSCRALFYPKEWQELNKGLKITSSSYMEPASYCDKLLFKTEIDKIEISAMRNYFALECVSSNPGSNVDLSDYCDSDVSSTFQRQIAMLRSLYDTAFDLGDLVTLPALWVLHGRCDIVAPLYQSQSLMDMIYDTSTSQIQEAEERIRSLFSSFLVLAIEVTLACFRILLVRLREPKAGNRRVAQYMADDLSRRIQLIDDLSSEISRFQDRRHDSPTDSKPLTSILGSLLDTADLCGSLLEPIYDGGTDCSAPEFELPLELIWEYVEQYKCSTKIVDMDALAIDIASTQKSIARLESFHSALENVEIHYDLCNRLEQLRQWSNSLTSWEGWNRKSMARREFVIVEKGVHDYRELITRSALKKLIESAMAEYFDAQHTRCV